MMVSLVLVLNCAAITADNKPDQACVGEINFDRGFNPRDLDRYQNCTALELVCVADININHKTDPASLDKYKFCTVLEGFIQINSALREYQKPEEIKFSFPNLVEITDYLLLYRANQFENLTSILPRLAVIRGHRLVHNYALAIYQMKNLRTVGLLNLASIMNGGVRIEKNPSLCNVDTVDWEKIVEDPLHNKHHIFIEENMDSRSCSDSCPDQCENNCWDQDNCQIMLVKCPGGADGSAGQGECYTNNQGVVQPPCSGECLGGCYKQNSPEHCFACKNVWFRKGNDNNTVCVEKCPDTTLSYMNWKCITESTCAETRRGPAHIDGEPKVDQVFKIHNVSKHDQQCVDECPANFQAVKNNETSRWECKKCTNCPRHCDGGPVVNSRFEAEKYRYCTHIDGDLEIRVSEGDITPVLEDSMKDIKVISGKFKISRSFALVSFFDFFKSLEEIKGQDANGEVDPESFVITIMENENLQKLFPKNVTVGGGKGKAFIHYNQKLCMEEINNFIAASTLAPPQDFEVSKVTNGNKAVCSKEELGFNVTQRSSQMILYSMQNYRQNLHNRENEDVNALIGYEIYYREITEEQSRACDQVSKFEGLNACEGNTWHIEDRRPKSTAGKCTDGTKGCGQLDGNQRLVYQPEIGFLGNLKPYTPYAVYATTLMVPHLATEATGAQSKINCFRTKMKPPEEVRDLKWEAESFSELRVSWKPPLRPHGIIDHYDIVLDYIPLTELKDRDYCDKEKDKDKYNIEVTKAKEREKTGPGVNATSDSCPTCSCAPDDASQWKIQDNAEEHIDEQNFYNHLIDKIFTIPISRNDRLRRSVSGKASSGNSVSGSGPAAAPNYFQVNIEVAAGQTTHEKFYNTTALINGSNVYSEVYRRVPGNMTEVVIGQLKHFAMYQVKVMACQKERPLNPKCKVNCVMQKDCSSWALEEAKTKPKPNADDLVNKQLEIFTANETTGETYIRWIPPADPNEMILKYTLQITTSLEDLDNYKAERCIPLSSLVELEDGTVQYRLRRAGEYWIKLKAVSLNGDGGWTTRQKVKVDSNATVTWIILTVALLLVLVAAAMSFFVFRRYKKKNQRETQWEIVSRNPEYHDTGYTMDGWEVSRDLIEKGEELGSGSFGVCHRGVYKHQDKGSLDVAIKTVPDHATFRQRVEFLNEASVMKEINTAHVVKLLGVVSQGQPTLVLMELMEHGDLRKYLRSLRPDNKDKVGPPPELKRILQMALEIADGMAYLSVRKYVHRDLAARNCMVSADFVVKVGDFGMAQDVYEREYYRTEGRRLLPVRWMAPESLRDGRFTSKSDVWGYGVVLWEMATLAEQPYQGWCNDEVVKLVKDGNVMQKPDDCPDILYDMMKECWARNPDNRPSFIDLCEKLLPEASENFLSNAFYLSSQGSEAVANQNSQRLALEEAQQDHTPLNTNPGMNSDNGHAGDNGGENVPLHDVGPRSPVHVTFNTDRNSRNKISLNGIGFGPRARNKSGSNSGEA